MAVRMRLTRVGSKKNPIYRVVVADSRSPRDGRFIEIVGRYNPQTDPSTIDLDAEKVKDWLAKGSGTTVQQVNQLLSARKQMAKMVKQMGKGKMPNIQSIAAAQKRR